MKGLLSIAEAVRLARSRGHNISADTLKRHLKAKLAVEPELLVSFENGGSRRKWWVNKRAFARLYGLEDDEAMRRDVEALKRIVKQLDHRMRVVEHRQASSSTSGTIK